MPYFISRLKEPNWANCGVKDGVAPNVSANQIRNTLKLLGSCNLKECRINRDRLYYCLKLKFKVANTNGESDLKLKDWFSQTA